MLKVVVNAVAAKSGGSTTYVENLWLALPSVAGDQEYVLCVPEQLAQRLGPGTATLRTVASDVALGAPWKRFVWDQVTLRRLLKTEGADVLISASDFGMAFPPCPQILMLRNALFSARRWLVARSVGFADKVVTASASMMDDVGAALSIPEERCVVNPFGVPLERFRVLKPGAASGRAARANGGARPWQVLYVAWYSDYKNITTALRAVVALRDRGVDDFCLTITGSPEQFPDVEISSREVDRRLAADPLIAPHLRFLTTDYREIGRLYADSDVFLFASLAESFGHPLIEAMAAGLPIVASDIPICREICGDAAIYFSPVDADDLADKLLLVRRDRELRDRLRQAGKARVESSFDWREHLKRLVALVQQVAECPR